MKNIGSGYYSAVLKFLGDCVKGDSLFLDAGCGEHDRISQSRIAEHVGVDILRSNLYTLKNSSKNISCVLADLTLLPFKQDSFEGVVSIDVLEHIKKKAVVIKEFARVTRKGGFFIGVTTNLLNPALWLDAKMYLIAKPLITKFSSPPNEYERHDRFSPSSLIKTMKTNGFRTCNLALLGFPQFKTGRINILDNLWTLFDVLSERKPLCYFKEMLVWQAERV